ncbi:alpha/beta fold hydrolase [Nesterenkonia haasae]|uniref:alpha/beta fold hydrolase n=1 Tax=Nesterenkonia haasae TaxID=2587813 RepID=UPI001390E984|nr:alpha/beta hydrolase [Nesterenkonia haasae]NDK30626.1 alpha/beta hydrolase [Nesterenkonia haasae]
MRYVGAGVLAGLGAVAAWLLRGGPRLPPDTDAIIERLSQSDLSHVVAGETGYADSSGVRIWYEAIPARAPEKGVVLLNISMAGNSLFWPPSFIRGLTGAGYRVIRYDQRGTGASDWLEDWDRKHAYSLLDMSADAIAVLDATQVDRAHLIGLSLGGFVAQEIAIAHPDKVASMTLMSSAADPTDASLPGLRSGPLLRSALAGLPLLRYRLMGGEKNLVKEVIAKTISGNGYEGLHAEELTELVLYDLRYRRGINLRAILQHQAAVAATRSRYELLPNLRVPALVVHGTADTFIPVEHAEKLVELIPGAQYLWLEGVGHQFPYPDMTAVTREIVSHLDHSA